MELVRGLHNLRAGATGCALTIGNFDGVHRGHQALIGRTVALARRLGVPATVLSFEPTPREFFAPECAPGRISTLRGKLLDLRALGVDRLIVQRFDRGFAACEAGDFVRDILCARLGIRAIVVGDDFRFGARRAGDLNLLRVLGRDLGFTVEGIGSVEYEGLRCSSTAVRAALAAAELERAALLLGRAYRLVGRVRGGLRLGRRLGMPTANIHLTRRPALRLGVYVVELRRLCADQDVAMPAVANLGVRPTLGLTRCLLETHVLDREVDLYGATVEVRFLRFLRPEARFDTLDALAAQMQRDKAAALAFFAAESA
ncbi:bifunctional riboflavin kinase/FAD synthetase [Sinimarinibacterium thermocellulolyticum]|uniref:Riboflavin biosynthesis protein n=1 Tax=Sinimarinibacterium thermocellulolyticum TaxID=3170016 RepID=A0ABV2A859_9GAMM